MTVYVDNMKLKAKLFRWNGTGSNLWADTTEELEDFAEELGLSVVSMVDRGYTTERYIINEQRRKHAIGKGAVPLQYMGAGTHKLIRRKRESGRWKEKDE